MILSLGKILTLIYIYIYILYTNCCWNKHQTGSGYLVTDAGEVSQPTLCLFIRFEFYIALYYQKKQ